MEVFFGSSVSTPRARTGQTSVPVLRICDVHANDTRNQLVARVTFMCYPLVSRNYWVTHRECRAMAEENVRTDSVEHEVVIKAPVAVVWALVTQPEHVAQWYAFDGADIELRPGGRLAFRWREHGEYRGRVESVEPPHRFAFRFVGHVPDQDPVPGNSTLVEFLLEDRVDSTLLRVVESGFAALTDQHEGALSKAGMSLNGWRGGFAALENYAGQQR
jgi:uncharacterized protein YndB with AHSA1/START domain